MGKNGVHNKLQVRLSVKIAFVREFEHLFKSAGYGPLYSQGHRCKEGKLVVEKARKLIGYSDKYSGMDIYRNLYYIYKDIFNLK